MPLSKPEFPPLFASGFHDIEIEQFDRYFIEPFEDKERRLFLKERFFALLNKIAEIGIDIEIWIDGSYATEKEHPADIDLMMIYELEDEDALSVEKHRILDYIINTPDIKTEYNCDLICTYSEDLDVINFYKELYGLSRKGEPKGIARFRYIASSENEISD